MDESIRDISRDPTKLTVETDILGVIGERLRTCCGAMSASSVVVVTDHQVGELYAERVLDSLRGADFSVGEFRIDAGEASKSLEVAASIYQYLAARELDRDGVIVALVGGGGSGPLGFVAATWRRGVRRGDPSPSNETEQKPATMRCAGRPTRSPLRKRPLPPKPLRR